jgi:outer membrane protein assembly factor BamE
MRARILTLVVLLLLAGCSSVPSLLYKIEVQQGNVITQEMVDKLKPGMTRSQVRFALGSPMISDAFHENRWDYVYRLEQKGQLVEQRNLTVFFEEDKLVRIDGTFSPLVFAQHEAVEEPAVPRVKEQARSPVSGEVPGPEAVAVPGDIPTKDIPAADTLQVPTEVTASTGPALRAVPDSSSSPSVSDTSDLTEPVRSPRQAPSQAWDRGNKGADQLKE